MPDEMPDYMPDGYVLAPLIFVAVVIALLVIGTIISVKIFDKKYERGEYDNLPSSPAPKKRKHYPKPRGLRWFHANRDEKARRDREWDRMKF